MLKNKNITWNLMLTYRIYKQVIKIITFPIFISPLRKKIKNYLKINVFKMPHRRQKAFYNYVVKYCGDSVVTNNISTHIDSENLPIWQIWFQGENLAPDIVKLCFKSIDKYANNRRIIRLTEKNIHQYIELPDYILEKYKKGIITHAHLSDIIRVCLLAKHGGTWIDATVLLSNFIPASILNSQFFAFHITKESTWFDCHDYLTSASWFLHSQPNNNLMCSVRNALFNYWEHEDSIVDYFLIYFIFKCLVDRNNNLAKEWNSSIKITEDATHQMQLSFNNSFNSKKLEQIKENSSIHKLTYHYKTIIDGSLLDILLKNNNLFY